MLFIDLAPSPARAPPPWPIDEALQVNPLKRPVPHSANGQVLLSKSKGQPFVGVLQNPSFVDYRIATGADAPPDIQTIIIEVPQDDGPWSARGVGEHPMVPTIPAIANAIYDAIGVRVGSSPFTAVKVYLAMVQARRVA